jgi:anti-sigma factor RsiW
VTDILNPNASGGAAERVFFSVQDLGHPTACAAGGCAMSFVDSPWQASTSFAVGQEVLVLASNTLYINVAIVAGTTGSTAPAWPNVVGALTLDGGVTWLNQGLTTLVALPNWAASHTYTAPTRILDSNGNVEIATVSGVSGTPNPPAWSTTAGGLTVDGTATWINAGVLPSAALASAGGTSGIIIDNFVGSGTMAGASQVYFSTLSDQLCTTSATTGGCAMQASQSALK